MEKCTSTGQRIYVGRGASLVMVDCRFFGSGLGVHCVGKLVVTRCKIEDSKSDGEFVEGGEAKLVESVMRNNGGNGMNANSRAILEGGTISGNKQHGVLTGRAKVIVAAAEHCEQTVSSGNGEHSWATQYGGKIAGLAEGIQAHGIQAHFADALTFA